MLLNEFHIKIVPAKAIKGKAVADFMTELTPRAVAPREEEWWTVHVDESFSKVGCCPGVVIKTPTGEKAEYLIHFKFCATNNAVDPPYESQTSKSARFGKSIFPHRLPAGSQPGQRRVHIQGGFNVGLCN